MENKLVNNWIEGEREREGKVLPTASCQFCIGVYACNAEATATSKAKTEEKVEKKIHTTMKNCVKTFR